MSDITEGLIILLEDLYVKDYKLNKVIGILEGDESSGGSGLSLILNSIGKLELLIVQSLGGKRKHLTYCREIGSKNPFDKLEQGEITRSEFLKQIKRVIELDLEFKLPGQN